MAVTFCSPSTDLFHNCFYSSFACFYRLLSLNVKLVFKLNVEDSFFGN
uniref:Uncharacterized protein n=1 Tax=Rhizophora mucronata TaxID=61149 RepID=A0A2P2IXE1_RHIMU